MYINTFFDSIRNIMDQVEKTQADALQRAAHLTADSLILDGIVHVFGTGHSHILAEDVFFRAGGLVQVDAILDAGLMLHVSGLGSTKLERLSGYTPIVLARYDLRPKDIMVVVSNSGRNAGPIEAALYAKEKGLTVIAITSAAAYRNSSVRHPCNKHLFDIADIVIDTCVPHGDAIISIPGMAERIGPVSTIVGSSIIQAYLVETVHQMVERGHQPKVIISANVESDQNEDELYKDYANRIRHW